MSFCLSRLLRLPVIAVAIGFGSLAHANGDIPQYCVDKYPSGSSEPTNLEARRQECALQCGISRDYFRRVAGKCLDSTADDTNDPSIPGIRNRLINSGAFTREDFAGVTFRYCKLAVSAAVGIVAVDGLVILHPKLKSDRNLLTRITGHEMVHVKQYRRWGEQGYYCRYSGELLAGHGFSKANEIEREAYEFDAKFK